MCSCVCLTPNLSSLARTCPQRRPSGGLLEWKAWCWETYRSFQSPASDVKAFLPPHTSAGHRSQNAQLNVCECVYSRGGGHFLGSGSNTNYSAIWWSAPSQSSLTLLSEETCCAQCHGFALWHMSFICTSTHARTHQFMCTCVCNRWEWRGIVRGGSAEMCFPARSLYPPVLTPLGDRPPGNKSRLSDTLHPCSATTTTTTTTTHTPSQQSTKK